MMRKLILVTLVCLLFAMPMSIAQPSVQIVSKLTKQQAIQTGNINALMQQSTQYQILPTKLIIADGNTVGYVTAEAGGYDYSENPDNPPLAFITHVRWLIVKARNQFFIPQCWTLTVGIYRWYLSDHECTVTSYIFAGTYKPLIWHLEEKWCTGFFGPLNFTGVTLAYGYYLNNQGEEGEIDSMIINMLSGFTEYGYGVFGPGWITIPP